MEPESRWRSVLGAGCGAFFAALVVAAFTVVGIDQAVRRHADKIKAQWQLTPVVVAATDRDGRLAVTWEDLSQRSLPERIVTASVVRPDRANEVKDQFARVPLSAGEAVRWGAFWTARGAAENAAHQACAQALPKGAALTNASIRERLHRAHP